MHTRTAGRFLVVAAALAAGGAARAALNASATVLTGDRLHGNILVAGDEDRVFVDLAGGETFSADLRAEKGSAILPSLVVLDGNDQPVDLAPYAKPGPGGVGVKARKVPVAAGDTFTFVVTETGSNGGKYVLRVTETGATPSKRDLYLSPSGFGEAPRVTSVAPNRVLNDRAAPGMVVTGEGFDPGATVRLEKTGRLPIPGSPFTVDGPTQVTADFECTGAAPGTWRVVVENPSGGAGRGKLAVQSAGTLRLPSGVRKGTEVWWLEFDETEFRTDLVLMGLGSSSSTVAGSAENAVKSYTLFFARRAFGLSGLMGKGSGDAVPVCFVLDQPSTTLGLPGQAYDRLRIGGAAGVGDPSSNPAYPWGDGPLDAGNASYDDVSADGGTGRGVRTRVFDPASGYATAAWQAALAPLLANPLTGGDVIYFDPFFFPADAAQGTRYRQITKALQTVGKELGGTIAHFVARAMGLPDGTSGLSAPPASVGIYVASVSFGFTTAERASLAASARDPALPGTSIKLRASYLPLRETEGYLLPEVVTARSNTVAFRVAGGRPDLDAADLEFTGQGGFIPAGTDLTTDGTITGVPPLFVPFSNRQIYGGVFRFRIKCKDSKTGDATQFNHRINLIADENNAALAPGEKNAAAFLNSQTRAAP